MKLALLVGVSYLGTESVLHGTVHDVEKMEPVLERHFGFDPSQITVLAERAVYSGSYRVRAPTRANILNELLLMAEKCNVNPNITEIFFQYSGHGTYIKSAASSETDRRDECIVPMDYDTEGVIMDDEINEILADFPSHVTFVGIVDACHSGTMFDLPYRYVTGFKHVIESTTSKIKCKCLMLSGCRDNQVSMDAFDLENAKEYAGAMSTSFRAALEVHGYVVSVWQLQKHMWRFLKKRKFKQRPQVTTNILLNRDHAIHSIQDISSSPTFSDPAVITMSSIASCHFIRLSNGTQIAVPQLLQLEEIEHDAEEEDDARYGLEFTYLAYDQYGHQMVRKCRQWYKDVHERYSMFRPLMEMLGCFRL